MSVRRPRRSRPATAYAAAVALALTTAAGAGRVLADDPHSSGVRDLAYGEALFHFHQQDYFSALVRLLAADARNELTAHQADAELLLGGLYLSYGQHRLAGEIFERVLGEHHEPVIRDRAWFFLAKVWRQRGYLEEAEGALARIGHALPAELEPERQMLTAEVLMDQGRFDEAREALAAWPTRGTGTWADYAEYNLGVALVRLGRVAEGAAMLDRLGAREPSRAASDASVALRDRANVALGYAWLQAGAPAEAKPPLQRVRLNGPFSSKALLGVGWADAEQREYRTALVPWLELKGRDLLDAAVQESLLAVPFAFVELGADAQAAGHYEDAIAALDGEIERLERTMDAFGSGGVIEALIADPDAEASGWYWELATVPDTVESRYLYELLSTHAFQEALKSYRDVLLLSDNLEQWAESLAAFDDILDTRQRAYDERRPVVDASLERLDLDAAARRRVDLESRLTAIERGRDVVALGTPDEQRLWDELTAVERRLALFGDDPAAVPLRDKQRFLKGLLEWDLERDYKARLWQQRSELRRLDLELKTAQARRYSVITARDAWHDRFAALTARIDALAPRLAGLRDTAGRLLDRERRYLEALAVDELEARRERLATYRVQARFALAAIYDRAATSAAAAGVPR